LAAIENKNITSRPSRDETSRYSFILFRRVSAILLIMASILIFLGWGLQIKSLVVVRSGWPPVAPLTTLNFFCIGILLLILPKPEAEKSPLETGIFLAVSILLLVTSALVLDRHFLHLDLPVDMMMFSQASAAMDLDYRSMMPPATAWCFFLTGLLFISDFVKPRSKLLKSAISFFVLALSFLMIGAYFYGAASLFELPIFFRMSIVTAVMFAISHLAILSADPLFGWKFQSPIAFWRSKNTAQERPLYASLLVVFTVFIVAGVATSQSLNRLFHTIQNISETQKHIQDLDKLMMGLLNAESGQRGYLLTGEDEFLDRYFQGVQEYETALSDLDSWIMANPQYVNSFQQIEATARVKIKELGEMIIWRREKGLAAANKVIQTDVGKLAIGHIHEWLLSIKSDQVRVLAEQREENQKQVRSTVTSITIGSLIATVLLLICLNLYLKNSMKRSEVEDQVRNLNRVLEGKLHEIEVVNKELESFSYSVSHDLRAPLRAMAGFSNILIEDYHDQIDETGRGYLRRIIAASERMSRLIDGILDLSRISRRQVRCEDVAIDEIAEQIVAELRASEPHRQVEVVIEPGMRANGDPDLISAVVQNLLANAWKFTSRTVNAKISMGSFNKEDGKVFFVRDNGAGFDMAYAEKLFGTFQRLHSENEFKGTGVGLATVRRIVHLHGGDVWAEGAVNQGATFYFTLG